MDALRTRAEGYWKSLFLAPWDCLGPSYVVYNVVFGGVSGALIMAAEFLLRNTFQWAAQKEWRLLP
jgi:hypothetical protein